MAKILATTSLALLAICFAAGAAAQTSGNPDRTSGNPDRIVLAAKAGSVMTSASGEYQTANVGKRLVIGESMMVGDESTATVVYFWEDDAGNVERKCVERYVGANTFIIDESCNAAVGVCCNPVVWVPGTPNAAGAGIIIGAGLIGAAILYGTDDVPPGPLSTGPNGTIRHF